MPAATMTTPTRSLEQRQSALVKANHIRTYRKVLKRQVKREGKPLDAVIANPPAELLTMKVFDLLITQPKWGRVKVGHILKARNISPSKTVGGLSVRQRGELLVVLRDRRRG
jgi:hypothetical protein